MSELRNEWSNPPVFNSPPHPKRYRYEKDTENGHEAALQDDLRKMVKDIGLEGMAKEVGIVDQKGFLSPGRGSKQQNGGEKREGVWHTL